MLAIALVLKPFFSSLFRDKVNYNVARLNPIYLELNNQKYTVARIERICQSIVRFRVRSPISRPSHVRPFTALTQSRFSIGEIALFNDHIKPSSASKVELDSDSRPE